ncbi:AfsR/SARP family transcriptional regulator, partial [Streptomyces carpinensis]
MSGIRFRILGPLEITGSAGGSTGETDAGVSHTPRAAKLRVVLGTLLVRANEVVSVDSLIDELWPTAPPRTATTTLQVYVSQVRKLLRSADPRHGQDVLITRSPGYVLRAVGEELDAVVFEEVSERGRRALAAGDFASAARLLRQAVGLWRGPVLSDTPHGPLLESAAVRLAEARMTALGERIQADLRLGRHQDLVGELQSLTAEHPLREDLHLHLMVALYRCSRAADALEAYGVLRRTLVNELGIEPGPRSRTLQRRILEGDAALLTPGGEPQASSGRVAGQTAAGSRAAVGEVRARPDGWAYDRDGRARDRRAAAGPVAMGPGSGRRGSAGPGPAGRESVGHGPADQGPVVAVARGRVVAGSAGPGAAGREAMGRVPVGRAAAGRTPPVSARAAADGGGAVVEERDGTSGVF